jgi:glycosyltransferase involved in cell wall biosynthesis
MDGAAFVCVVGKHLRQQVLDQTTVPQRSILETCMGVDTSTLAALGNNRVFTLGSLHLVTVARLDPAKGHVHALAALSRGLHLGLDLRYTIAGGGAYKDALLAIIDDLNLSAKVTLTGTLSEAEVFQLLSTADVFVLPSTRDAWPVSVMEAMASGLPVISSVVGATNEMINSGENGFLIPQRDERALLEVIELLANDLATRRRIGEAARRSAARRFNVETTAAFLRDAIRASLRQGTSGLKNEGMM